MSLPLSISGTMSSDHLSDKVAHISSAGAVYVVLKSSSTYDVEVYKCSNVDTGSFSLAQTLSPASTFQGQSSITVGNVIHITSMASNDNTYYWQWTMDSDSENSLDSVQSNADNYYSGIAVKSNGDIYVAGCDSYTSMGKIYERVVKSKSTDGGSSFGSKSNVSSLSSTRLQSEGLVGVTVGDADRVHFVYTNHTGSQCQLYHRSFDNPSDGSDQQIATDVYYYTTDNHAFNISGGGLRSYVDGASTKLFTAYIATAANTIKAVTATSAAQPSWSVATAVSSYAERRGDWNSNTLGVAVNGTDLFIMFFRTYADETQNPLPGDVLKVARNTGSGWSVDNGYLTSAQLRRVYCNVFERNGSMKLAYVYVSSGVWYGELDLGAASSGTVFVKRRQLTNVAM